MNSRIVRYILMIAGSLSLLLAVLGILIPVLPTTPFLLLASFCYLRSSKRLYDWLTNHRVFGPYIYNYVTYKAIKKSVKIKVILLLWASLILSMVIVVKIHLTIFLIIVGVGVSIHLLKLKTYIPAEQAEGSMNYRFPKDLYTDIRLETVFRTSITLENYELKQSKTKKDRGAMIRIFDGNRWYYSATTDLENLQQEIDRLAVMAVPNPAIQEHPLLKRLEVNRERCLKYQGVNVAEIDLQRKLDLLNAYVPILKQYEEIKMSRMYYLDKYTEKRIISSMGTDVTFDSQSCCLAVRYMLQENQIPYQGSEDLYALTFEELAGKQEKIAETLRKDLAYCREAVPVKPGTYTCIFSPQTAGVFAHESFGHKSEADFMVGDETMKKEWAIGKKVGAEILNIIDTGTIEGAGYVPFDDEGCKAKVNYLIKDGILTGRLHSTRTAALLEEAPTGNSRAINFEYEPIVRMTTTYIDKGSLSKEALFEGVEEGIYIDNLNHGSGMTTFTIAPRRAYMIRGGKVAEPVRISVITGNVMKTLYEIDGISDQVELFSFALGGCGKMEQYPLPVAFGGPYIRVKQIQVM